MGFPWNMALGALGKWLDAKSAKDDQQAAQQYAQEFMEMVQYNPHDVNSPLGGITFGEDGVATSTLSPEMQQQMDGLFNQAQGYSEALASYDPDAMHAQQYGKMQAYADPLQQRARQANMAQQVAQGVYGSRGGAGQTQSLLDSQAQDNLARDMAAWDMVNNQQQLMQQGQTNAYNNILNLTQPLQGLFNVGAQWGAAESGANALGGEAMLLANTSENTGGMQWGNLLSNTGTGGVSGLMRDSSVNADTFSNNMSNWSDPNIGAAAWYDNFDKSSNPFGY